MILPPLDVAEKSSSAVAALAEIDPLAKSAISSPAAIFDAVIMPPERTASDAAAEISGIAAFGKLPSVTSLPESIIMLLRVRSSPTKKALPPGKNTRRSSAPAPVDVALRTMIAPAALTSMSSPAVTDVIVLLPVLAKVASSPATSVPAIILPAVRSPSVSRAFALVTERSSAAFTNMLLRAKVSAPNVMVP